MLCVKIFNIFLVLVLCVSGCLSSLVPLLQPQLSKQTEKNTTQPTTATTTTSSAITDETKITTNSTKETTTSTPINCTNAPLELPTSIPALNKTVQNLTLNEAYPHLNCTVPQFINKEVEDLNENSVIKQNISDISATTPNITIQDINRETELIEDGQNTEDVIRVSNLNQTSKEGDEIGVPIVQGQLAGILAGVFVVISVMSYVALLTWRRFLENRYGNREMLVNEDDFNYREDLRHFSI